MSSVIRILAEKCLLQLRTLLAPGSLVAPVRDVCRRGGLGPRGRALLVYRALPFHLSTGHHAFTYHQSLVQSRLIAGVLDELGYCCDVVDHAYAGILPQSLYQLVISHKGDLDPSQSAFREARRVYLASGTEHCLHNERQRARLDAFRQRVGNHQVELQWDVEEMPWTSASDAIFCFGNDFIAQAWRDRFKIPVYAFQNTKIRQLDAVAGNPQASSKHFLFLGSRQQLAKGLDLLLESFAGYDDLHLHVCGHYLRDPIFCEVYKKMLFGRRNIHPHGWVDVTSRKFRRIADQCRFTISATCAEGSPGSITNVMGLGLIPLLPAEAGLDFGDGIIRLNDLSVAGIRAAIERCSAMAPDLLAAASQAATARATREFSEDVFRRRWLEMLGAVIGAS